MTILSQIQQTNQITQPNRKKKKQRKLKAVKPEKSREIKYRKQLQGLFRVLAQDIEKEIGRVLRTYEKEYFRDTSLVDAYAGELDKAFLELEKKYAGLTKQAEAVSADFVNGINKANKQRFYKSVEKTIGINVQSVVNTENLEDILRSKVSENVGLIKTIPEEQFKKIKNLVYNGTTRGLNATSMIAEIQKIGKVSEGRARVIARDQSSKLNSVLSQQRAVNLGIEEYTWLTVDDGDRVRDSHRKKHKKTFRYDSPPKDTGHPGEDIQCRCLAQPIIRF